MVKAKAIRGPAFGMTRLEPSIGFPADMHVWWIQFNLKGSLDCPSLVALAQDERDQARWFLRDEDALRYAATRTALRKLLGAQLGMPPCALRFVRDGFGRPTLAPMQSLDFNVSHSGNYGLIAFSDRRRVGVDIEEKRKDFDWHCVASSVLVGPDAEYIARLPDRCRQDAFYAMWTAKEALSKALGTGLTHDLLKYPLMGSTKGRPLITAVDPLQQMRPPTEFDAVWIEVVEGYASCVAWEK